MRKCNWPVRIKKLLQLVQEDLVFDGREEVLLSKEFGFRKDLVFDGREEVLLSKEFGFEKDLVFS